MIGPRFHLFTLLGFPIRADLSWFVVAVLLSWSYAGAVLPTWHEGYSTPVYWAMGISLTLGLFASVLLHEVSHALAARHYRMPIEGITLFIFGGVAEMRSEPPHPRAELVVALAGPALSVVLGGLFGVAWAVGREGLLAEPLAAVLGWLAVMNLILVAFNLIPAFPLDGGRALRAVLWDWRGSLTSATRVTSKVGSGFGLLLLAFGGFLLLQGDAWGGIWYALIGLFLRNAARSSNQHQQLKQALAGEPVSRFMHDQPISVPRAISIDELVSGYVLRYHHQMFPVVDGDRLVGMVTTDQVKSLPREEWARQSVGAIATPVGDDNTVSPDTDAMEALTTMSTSGHPRLLVTEDGALRGILTLEDLLRFYSSREELERG
jgi:Zn-dependent protease/predicted transcriptional regulator